MLFYIIFFFFFKQKTAYEMRISDWSSDVCSSDLARGKVILRKCTPQCAWLQVWHSKTRGYALPSKYCDLSFFESAEPGARFGREESTCSRMQCSHQEIGRASGRERVCQYV